MKKLFLSVSDFAVPAPRVGSIETYSGYGRGAEAGLEIHQKIQAERKSVHADYQSEVRTTHVFEREGFQFEIVGRMDGIFPPSPLQATAKIEEIKSSFNVHELWRRIREDDENHPYCWQLRTYGYFYWKQNQEKPDLQLTLVSSRNEERLTLDLRFDPAAYEDWLEQRLSELVLEARLAEKRMKRRKKAASHLEFPFQNPRAGQVELIETIEEGMSEKRPMLIQAPTGLGKTMGVLYPTLKEALARGQKVVYVTPKNSQHGVAEEAVEKLQDKGANVRAMTLTAKTKMCFKNEPICNPDFCEYAKDHYKKISEKNLPAELARKRSLTAKTFKKMAKENEVCPFELQMEAVADADAVICDYNYVFSARSPLTKLTGLEFEDQGRPNLVIDEAHNLPSRSMDAYSPSLSTFTLEQMRADIGLLPKRFQADAKAHLEACIEVVKGCAPQNGTANGEIKPPVAAFLAQDAELRGFLSAYLKADVEIEPNDVVLRLSFYWSEFTSALEFVTGGREEFFTTYQSNPPAVKITCCDASEMLKESYRAYEQVVAFSATLKPFEYYAQLTGLDFEHLKTAEFQSPFPKHQRKVMIIPQLSSKYSEREKNYPRIADAISRIIDVKRGNYFAFFPSFDFLNRVLSELKVPRGIQVLTQQRRMSRDDIQDVMDRLKEPGLAHLVLGVQGGVFSEGVDFPGDLLIGAFVVGPPLPNFDLEREKMRAYYEENYASGFDYAYTYPAMAKAVQAAGRVIRSESDKGVIILMDNRFTQPSYVKSMPQDWFERSPQELVSNSILNDLSEFWNS